MTAQRPPTIAGTVALRWFDGLRILGWGVIGYIHSAVRGNVVAGFMMIGVEQVDLVTMVAVLHHLDVRGALKDVRRILARGGRFLCVGLAPPLSLADQLWDIASMVTNPVIGYVHHPWVPRHHGSTPPAPVKEPQLSIDELRMILDQVMPEAQLKRRLGFRHTIEWTKSEVPAGQRADPRNIDPI